MLSRSWTSSVALLAILGGLLCAAPVASAQTIQPRPSPSPSPKPPPDRRPPGCDHELAKKNTPEGWRCRDYLYETECEKRSSPLGGLSAWCHERRERRWAACQVNGQRTAKFENWCDKERERRREAGEPLVTLYQPDPGLVKPWPEPRQDRNTGQPSLDLGQSPSCRYGNIGSQAKERCRITGSSYREYPWSHYGVDGQTNVSLTMFGESVLALLQWLISVIWFGILLVVEGTLMLIDWAFSADPLGDSLGTIRDKMVDFHENVLGTSWTLAALAFAGAWGVWNGLLRLRTVQTLTGLAGTVALMILAMWVIYDPFSTVGTMGRLANDASLSVVGLSRANVQHPRAAHAESQTAVFDALVTRPWCMLQFGNVSYCYEATNQPDVSNMDLWLSFPAGSDERTAFYKAMGGAVGPDFKEQILDAGIFFTNPAVGGTIVGFRKLIMSRFGEKAKIADVAAKVRRNPERTVLQNKNGAIVRFALLAVVLLCVLGAIIVLVRIGIRLIMAAVYTLLLLMLTPVMLLMAAFGESGRATFGGFVKRTVGAAFAKLIYAIMLALFLAVGDVIWSLGGNDFMSLLFWGVYWWGLLFKFDWILDLISFDKDGLVMAGARARGGGAGGGGGGSSLMQAYFGYRAIREIGGAAVGAAKYLPSKASKLARVDRASRMARVTAQEDVIRNRAGAAKAKRADNAITTRKEHDLQRATGILGTGEKLERKLGTVKVQLARQNEAVRLGPSDPKLLQRREANRKRVSKLEAQLAGHRNDPETGWASSIAARHGGPDGIATASESEVRDWWTQRERDVAQWKADRNTWSSANNLDAAGIHPRRLYAATDAEKEQIRAKVTERLEGDRKLLQRSADGPLPYTTRVEATREIHGIAPAQGGARRKGESRDEYQRRSRATRSTSAAPELREATRQRRAEIERDRKRRGLNRR